MDTPTRRRVGAGLLATGGGIALVYAASRVVPKLMRRVMKQMMRSMMAEMMRGEGEFDPPET